MKRRNSVGAWAFVISSLFILSSCSQIGGNSVDNENSSMSSEPAPLSILNENGINYITHAPFRINSDAELAAMAASEGWAGDGTQGNPYIIENYDINGSVAGCCVFIGNTTKYLKVRNCYFHDANNSNEWDYHRNAGLFLYYTIQAMVENNNLSLNYYGLFLQYSGSSTNYYIANNTAENNYRSGLYIWSKDYNAVKQGFIINNTVVNNHGCGIELYETYSTILSGNNATGNGWDGIRLQNSRSSNIAGNIALNNTGAGISCIYNSWSDTIENNTVSGNNIGICIDDYSTDAWVGNNIVSANGKGIEVGIACYSSKVVNNTVSYNGDGIYLDNAQDCTIYHNSLIENVAQAYDSWGYYHRNMWSDSYPSGGNYWSDYTGLDMMQGQDQNIPGFDGIGDTPYSEIRWENEMDHFPLMRPWSEVFYAAKIPYAQIRINNNSEFDAAHGVSAGNGTVWSPWIIENYDINGTGYGYCIFVGNTTDYFKIKNCWLHEANGHSGAWFWNTALTLYNAQNGYVVGNYVNKSEYGQLLVSYSVNNTLTFNYCTENTFALGVESYCQYNVIGGNNFSANTYGIDIEFSSWNTFSNNNISSNANQGFCFYPSCYNNTVIGNNISYNGDAGVYFYLDCDMNMLEANKIWHNKYGVYIDNCDGNIVKDNSIGLNDNGAYLSIGSSNFLYTNRFISNTNQSYDNRNDNFWNASYPKGGNYWTNYTGIDLYSGPLQDQPGSDYIGDTPYVIDADSIDYYPLMYPLINGRIPRLPIRINSNPEFDAAHGVTGGNGTVWAPWVIENYDINGTGYGYCIYVGNTTDYFSIRNCNLHHASGDPSPSYSRYFHDSAIILSSMSHGKIIYNQITSNSKWGIYEDYYDNSSNVTISYNNITGHTNEWYGGMDIVGRNNTVSYNNVSSNYLGIYISSNFVDGNFVFNNTCNFNSDSGLSMYSSSIGRLSIYNNTVIGNGQYGIRAWWLNNTNISNNFVYNNPNYGIFLNYGGGHDINITKNDISNNQYGLNISGYSMVNVSDNIITNNQEGIGAYVNGYIYHNSIIGNTKQASENVNNAFWNQSYPTCGNYWSDYTGIDVMAGPLQNIPGPDGIGDTPYFIDADSRDYYPLMTLNGTVSPPPSFNIPIVAGWNLISIPLILGNFTLPGVLLDTGGDTTWDKVQWYDPLSTNHWKNYYAGWPAQLNDLTSVNHTMGVWVHVTNVGDGFINVYGSLPSSVSIPLKAGWNLVGYPTLNTTTNVGNAFWGTGADRVEVCDPTAPYGTKEVGSTYIMKPGEGYWIHVPADTVWIVNW